MILILIFILVIAYKLILNLFRLISTKYYYSQFEKQSQPLNQYAAPITALFNNAGTQQCIVIKDDVGFKRMYETYITTQLADSSFREKLEELFQQTISVYSLRMRQALYPSYWISRPAHFLSYLGYTPSKIVNIVFSIFIWIIGLILAYLFEHFLDSIHIALFFQNLLK